MNLTDQELKQLAHVSIQNGRIHDTIATFVLEKLSQKNLVRYVEFLKEDLKKRKVYIVSDEKLSSATEKELHDMFSGRDIETQEEKQFGVGMRVQIDDNILDLSLENRIRQTVETLKNEL